MQNYVGNVIFKAVTITNTRANIHLCSVSLQNVSTGWPMQLQAVARLEICTMRINIAL